MCMYEGQMSPTAVSDWPAAVPRFRFRCIQVQPYSSGPEEEKSMGWAVTQHRVGLDFTSTRF